MQYSLVKLDGEANLLVVVPGHEKPYVAHGSQPNFERIVQGVMADDPEVLKLFDIANEAAQRFEHLSERVSVRGGHVFFDGVEIDNSLTKQIARFVQEDVEDWIPLVNFYEKIMTNPNRHSRQQLYEFLDANDFTITSGGDFIAYKGVRIVSSEGADRQFESVNAGRAIVNGEPVVGNVPNYIGAIVEMPRNQVAHDPHSPCSTGLHVATYDFAKSFCNGAVLEVYINPRDVVSVPNDPRARKMRVCRYVVGDVADAPYGGALLVDGSRDDDEDYGDYETDEDDIGYEA